jgi:hypothetical protein
MLLSSCVVYFLAQFQLPLLHASLWLLEFLMVIFMLPPHVSRLQPPSMKPLLCSHRKPEMVFLLYL